MRGWLDTIRMPGGQVRLSRPVFFIRHGETDWNVERRYQGHSDTPLNDKGRAQAARNGAALKEALAGMRRVAFFSSPLSRATETLEIMRETMGLSRRRYGLDDRLIEIDLGAWNGRTYDEIAAEDPGVHERREREKWAFRAPGGESYADAAQRVREFLTGLDRVAVIVGHGATGRILRGYLRGLSPRRVPHLPAPQDKVFLIAHGREQEL
jgi:probable phosphoglycerate mutase